MENKNFDPEGRINGNIQISIETAWENKLLQLSNSLFLISYFIFKHASV
jgi:hypothetical protein